MQPEGVGSQRRAADSAVCLETTGLDACTAPFPTGSSLDVCGPDKKCRRASSMETEAALDQNLGFAMAAQTGHTKVRAVLLHIRRRGLKLLRSPGPSESKRHSAPGDKQGGETMDHGMRRAESQDKNKEAYGNLGLNKGAFWRQEQHSHCRSVVNAAGRRWRLRCNSNKERSQDEWEGKEGR